MPNSFGQGCKSVPHAKFYNLSTVYQPVHANNEKSTFGIYSCMQARSQDLEKGGGGGYFERVRSVQTTLTRIFIDLESISDGLSET